MAQSQQRCHLLRLYGRNPRPLDPAAHFSSASSRCPEAAAIARSWGWQEGDISLQSVTTHAEAASNRDERVMHDNYGLVIWSGSGERLDLLHLQKHGPSDGGEQLRQRIRALLRGDPSPALPSPLASKGETMIQARGADMAVQINAPGRSWAIDADLLSRYEILYVWDASLRRIPIGALDIAPTYRDGAEQALVELTLQTGNAPVALTGIVRTGASGDRAWCRRVEFEISVTYDPLVLAERRGG